MSRCVPLGEPPIPLQINPQPHSPLPGSSRGDSRGLVGGPSIPPQGVGVAIVGHQSPLRAPFVFVRYLDPTYRLIFNHGSLGMGKTLILLMISAFCPTIFGRLIYIRALIFFSLSNPPTVQWCIIRLTCSHPELTKDHVLTSAYVIIF